MAKISSRSDPIPALEWVSAALGLIVFGVLLAILVRDALSGEHDDLPLLSARVEVVRPVPGGHVVQFIVANGSGQTAAAVQVEGKVGDETASASIDYVPGHSEAKGGLMFKADPASGAELSVLGYELP